MHGDNHHHPHDHGGHGGHGHHGRHQGPSGGDHGQSPGTIGHNAPGPSPAQWQTPHLPHDHRPLEGDPRTSDLDLVEAAFVEGFGRAPDTISFLRLAGIPFVGETTDGRRLHLLRVETDDVVDVGALMPLVGGAGVRYDPLPAKMTSRRRRLALVYHDGTEPLRLRFAAARALVDRSDASRIDLPAC